MKIIVYKIHQPSYNPNRIDGEAAGPRSLKGSNMPIRITEAVCDRSVEDFLAILNETDGKLVNIDMGQMNTEVTVEFADQTAADKFNAWMTGEYKPRYIQSRPGLV